MPGKQVLRYQGKSEVHGRHWKPYRGITAVTVHLAFQMKLIYSSLNYYTASSPLKKVRVCPTAAVRGRGGERRDEAEDPTHHHRVTLRHSQVNPPPCFLAVAGRGGRRQGLLQLRSRQRGEADGRGAGGLRAQCSESDSRREIQKGYGPEIQSALPDEPRKFNA